MPIASPRLFDRCFADAAKYESIKQWRTCSPELYQEARRFGYVDACTEHMDLFKVDERTKRRHTPVAWNDKKTMDSFYALRDRLNALPEALTMALHGDSYFEVDHILPLNGETVSGLHVHNNLRVTTRHENRSKKNLVL